MIDSKTGKRCTRCKEMKVYAMFTRGSSWCKPCNVESKRQEVVTRKTLEAEERVLFSLIAYQSWVGRAWFTG